MIWKESTSQTNRLFRELLELEANAPLLLSQYIKAQKFGEAADLKDKERRIRREIMVSIRKCRTEQIPVILHLDGLKSQYYSKTIKARREDEFIFFIQEFGLPDVVMLEYDIEMTKTAYDCAKYLIIDCLEKRTPLPPFKVHGISLSSQKDVETLLTTFQTMTKSNTL